MTTEQAAGLREALARHIGKSGWRKTWKGCLVEADAMLRDIPELSRLAALDASPAPEPSADRAELWAKFTGGERLAYGIGYGDAKAAAPEPTGLDAETVMDEWDAMMAEMSESPLPGARYAWEIAKRRHDRLAARLKEPTESEVLVENEFGDRFYMKRAPTE